jgi:hypothetical protein
MNVLTSALSFLWHGTDIATLPLHALWKDPFENYALGTDNKLYTIYLQVRISDKSCFLCNNDEPKKTKKLCCINVRRNEKCYTLPYMTATGALGGCNYGTPCCAVFLQGLRHWKPRKHQPRFSYAETYWSHSLILWPEPQNCSTWYTTYTVFLLTFFPLVVLEGRRLATIRPLVSVMLFILWSIWYI